MEEAFMQRTVTCGALRAQDEGKTVVLGIRPEDLPRIFEKGFTGYNGRSDKKSTGIGLYLCKQIIEKLRCQIRVESKLGKGTRVLLHLMKEKLPVE